MMPFNVIPVITATNTNMSIGRTRKYIWVEILKGLGNIGLFIKVVLDRGLIAGKF